MRFHDVLEIIKQTAKDEKLSRPFIVGGTPRDRVRGVSKEVKDIDLTSENGDSVKLSFAVSKKLPYTFFQFFDDGHSCIKIGELQIDFSNHFIVPGIDAELDKLGIKNKTNLAKEMFSRDFTINTLLQNLEFNKIYDITGNGINDIKSGIIRCPIDPNIIIGSDPKRILRAIRFSLKFGYTINPDVVIAIKKHKGLLKNLSDEYVKNKANEILEINQNNGIKMLINLGLLDVIPITKTISDALIENKLLYHAFDPANNAI